MTSNEPAPDIPHRSTLDLMVLLFTVTVCASILLSGLAIALVALLDPARDTSRAVQALTSIIGTILGALLGLLAGRSERLSRPRETGR